MITFREGMGDILADGILGAGRRIGKGVDKYIQNVIKGQFVNRDPRLSGTGTDGIRNDAIRPSTGSGGSYGSGDI